MYSLDTGAGVHCNDGFVRVRGDVSTISVGIVASNEGVVEVDGDVTASQALTGLGVDVSGDGTVTVEGKIAAAQYLRLEDAFRSSEGYDTISSGYFLYSDGGNTVKVAIDQCIVPGCSVTVAAGGFSDYTDIDGVRHYHVTSALQLAHVRDHPHLSFLQTDDIDLGGNDWIPLGLTYDDPYRGHYDGGGHEITGLSVNQTTTGRNHSGGLFGFLAGDASVRNLSVFGDVSYDCTWYATATYAGGIAAAAIAEGEMSPLIDNCSFRGNVSSVAHLNSSTSSMQAVAGGIVGLIRGGTVRNSSFDSGVISAEMIVPSGSRTYAYAGAIAADAQDSEILNCYVGANGRTSSSDAAHTFSGGVVGQTLGQSHVNATYFAGEILGSTPASDSDWIGGICGAASDDTKVDGSSWNEACGTDLQVGNREATRDQGALSLAVMKTPSLRDKLEEALEGLGDDNLLSWIQTSGDYPVFAGEFWAPTPPSPPRRSGGDRSDPVLVSTETIEESIINSTDITASRTLSGWLAAPKSAVFDALLSKAMDTGGTRRDDSIVISIDDISETDELLVTLNSRDLTRISEKTSANLEIRTALMDVSLNARALLALISASDEDSVTLGMSRGGVRPGMPCWEIRAEGGGNPLSRLSSGYITVRIPHALAPDENPLTSVIRRVGEDDSFEIERGHYDEVSGVLVLRTSLLSSFALQQNSVEFADVPDDAWYREPVAFIAAREITSGTGDNKFSPDVPITRAQFVMLALNAYRLDRWIVDESPDSPAFVDITGGYYEEHLLLARRLGIVSGAGNDRFYPENPITRQEVFVIMRNLLNLIDELSDEKGIGELDRFVDGAEVAPWAQDATSTLVRAGIVKGDGYFLRPRAGATRAEIAQIFYELLSR
ncbi:MAG: S-layer homology domain-containing protein [Bacillota bacterium]